MKKKLSSFGSAFSKARKAGKRGFTYNGKEYTTRQKGESKKQHLSKAPKASDSAVSKWFASDKPKKAKISVSTKTSAKKSPAKKTVAKKSPVKKAVSKKSPAKKSSVSKVGSATLKKGRSAETLKSALAPIKKMKSHIIELQKEIEFKGWGKERKDILKKRIKSIRERIKNTEQKAGDKYF